MQRFVINVVRLKKGQCYVNNNLTVEFDAENIIRLLISKCDEEVLYEYFCYCEEKSQEKTSTLADEIFLRLVIEPPRPRYATSLRLSLLVGDS